MSNKEMCINLINRLPENELKPVVAILEMIDDLLDDAFCQRLMDEYDDSDERGDGMDIDSFAAELGIELYEGDIKQMRGCDEHWKPWRYLQMNGGSL